MMAGLCAGYLWAAVRQELVLDGDIGNTRFGERLVDRFIVVVFFLGGLGVTQEENELLNTTGIDRLMTLVEEATRATKGPPKRFIEPARGTLDRAKSRRHHIVFGRRGSGKTSLLRKAGSDLTLQRTPTAFIDLEAFKGHAYPDVLLSVLIETLHAFDEWLASAGINAATKKSWWHKLWGGEPQRPPLERKKLEEVRENLQKEIESLTRLLHSEDDVELIQQSGESEKTGSRSSSSGSVKSSASADVPGIKVDLGADGKIEGELTGGAERKTKLTERTKRNKRAGFKNLNRTIGGVSA